MKLTYAIEFVADMSRAVKFYRDVARLTLKFESPVWSEFVTGPTTLALHIASEDHPAGTVQLGFGVPELQQFHQEMIEKGVRFTKPPRRQQFGGELAEFVDSEGARCTLGSQ